MTSDSRKAVQAHYNDTPGEDYDNVRLEDPRGRLLSEHDRNIFIKMLDECNPGKDVVEIGAGTGRFTTLMLEKGLDVLATDINEPMLRVLRRKVEEAGKTEQCEVRIEDVFKLTMPDAAYDFGVCLHVIPRFLNLDDQKAALSEVCRVIKPGGRILINYRNSKSPYKAIFSGHTASPAEIEGCLRENGMYVVSSRGKWLLNRGLLNRLPLIGGKLIAAIDRVLEKFWTRRAWDVFLIAEKKKP